MGLCASCCGDNNGHETLHTPAAVPTPDPEVKRQQQLEAAERRLQSQEKRGIKNPEKVKQMLQKAEERDRLQEEAARRYDGTSPSLRGVEVFEALKNDTVRKTVISRGTYYQVSRDHNF